MLKERRTLSTVHLTDIQKEVLVKIHQAPSPTVADEQISKGRNYVAARQLLAKLDLVDTAEDNLVVTDTGLDVMKDEGLVDDAGELTEQGNKYATKGTEQRTPGPGPEIPPPPGPEIGAGTPPMPSLEGLTFFRQIHQNVQQVDLLEQLTSDSS